MRRIYYLLKILMKEGKHDVGVLAWHETSTVRHHVPHDQSDRITWDFVTDMTMLSRSLALCVVVYSWNVYSYREQNEFDELASYLSDLVVVCNLLVELYFLVFLHHLLRGWAITIKDFNKATP